VGHGICIGVVVFGLNPITQNLHGIVVALMHEGNPVEALKK
jgi:uncharacterized membrane protein YesL